MHKGIMIIVKTDNKTEALMKTKDFLEKYKDNVWDWYVIGGRWSNTLAPKYKEFIKWAEILLKSKTDKNFISQQLVEDNRGTLQKEWNKIGMKGNNPYFDHYRLVKNGDFYDVMPLKDCLDIVKSWEQPIEVIKKEEEKAKEWLNGESGTNDYNMYGYCLKIVANLYRQSFCFDCNIYNVEEYNYSIPKDTENYFVVIVDIHD